MKIDDIVSKIKFEDRFECAEYGTTTLYFIAPKELLCGRYPEAISAEISIEFPTNIPEARYAGVSLSPTKYDAENDSYTDYDWFDVDLSYEDIEKLMDLANAKEEINGNR